MKALHYSNLANKVVKCELCPHCCLLHEGQTGICRIRKNEDGELIAKSYNVYSSVGFDPIEKKPLYHYYPGKQILSVGSFGCNMRCDWCQNCGISQIGIENNPTIRNYSSKELLQQAISRANNIGIAYTYNEPTISFETNIETAKLFRANNLKNVLVSNGYLNHDVLDEYLKYIDAVNLDIKSFEPATHKKYTGANLQTILQNAIYIYKSEIHLELTYLVVPEVNDDNEEFLNFIHWVKEELSEKVPLHISRYFPRNNYNKPPTNVDTLYKFATKAKEILKYVYLGNTNSNYFQHTKCPKCHSEIIKRIGYEVYLQNVDNTGVCSNCGEKNIYKM